MRSMTKVEFVKQLWRRLEGDGTTFCVLRFSNRECSGEYSINMLLDDKRLNIGVQQYLKQLVEGLGWQCKIADEGDCCYSVICYELSQTTKIIKFNVYTQMMRNGIPWIDMEVVYNSVEKYKNIYIPAQGVEAAILVLHEVIKGGAVNKAYYNRIIKAVMCDQDNFIKVLEKPLGIILGYAVLNRCLNKDFKGVKRLVNKLHHHMMGDKPSLFINSRVQCLRESFRRICRPKGLLIVFVGPDGSGKSSVIKDVSRELRAVGKHVCNYHIRFKLFPEIRRGLGIASMNGKTIGKADRGQVGGGGDSKKLKRTMLSQLASCFIITYFALEFLVGKPIVYWKKYRGDYMIFDRYFYDFFAQPTTHDMAWKFRKLFMLCVPEPDIIIHLYADSEIVYSRKQELSVNHIKSQNKYYHRYMKECMNAYTIINENKRIDEISCEVFRLVGDKIL